MEQNNVYEALRAAMASDDEAAEKCSDKMHDAYGATGKDGRAAIDAMLIAICGYSFESLQERAAKL